MRTSTDTFDTLSLITENLLQGITILRFFRLFFRRQYVYVLTSPEKANQWLVENFAPFLLGSFHSKQKFKVSRQKAARIVNYLAVRKIKESDIQL